MVECRKFLPKKKSFAFGNTGTKGTPKIERISFINLNRQRDRLSKMEQELRHILDCSGSELWKLTERYQAIDASLFLKYPLKDNDVDPIYTLREQLFVEPQPLTLPTKIELDSPIKMSRPEIAIAHSHIEVWREVIEKKNDYVLVLEDDVWFRPNFAKKIDQAWLEIINQANKNKSFDILYLSYEEVKHGAPKKNISNNVFSPERGLWYLSGYVISCKGAKKLLSLLPCKGPIDLWINHHFKSLDVLAIRKPIISQRRDIGSSNSYSILPTLTKIGAINSEAAALFQKQPQVRPVFVFGTNNSGLSSLSMALSMLGYRCCSDLKTLPTTELKMLLNGSVNRIFDAYVNIGSLELEARILREKYPLAKVIITKSKFENLDYKDLQLIENLDGLDIVTLHLEETNKWKIICEHLRCAPPICSFPEMVDNGQRETSNALIEVETTLKYYIPKRDKSPWAVENNNSWKGINSITIKKEKSSLFKFNDNLNSFDSKQWNLREDTFTDNMAMFRPSNMELISSLGASISIKKESLGVRNYSSAALTSNNQYLYGKFEATIKASNVPGVVTGIFLHRNSPRQEIDIEITGNKPDRLLVNVFYNPGIDGSKYDYGYRGSATSIDLGFDASKSYHKYTIEWNLNEICWYVDNHLVHKRVNWNPTPIPSLPMAFHINIWPTSSRELAGRLINNKLPTSTFIKSITLETNIKTY